MKLKYLAVIILISIGVTSCEKDTKTINDPEKNSAIFNRVQPKESGIDFSNNLTENDSFSLLNLALMQLLHATRYSLQTLKKAC